MLYLSYLGNLEIIYGKCDSIANLPIHIEKQCNRCKIKTFYKNKKCFKGLLSFILLMYILVIS